MIAFEFEKDKFLYLLKFLGLIGITFGVWMFSSNEAANFVEQNEKARYLPLRHYSVSNPKKEPEFRVLSKEAQILASEAALQEKKNQFIAEKKDFIFADLESMKITLFKSGYPEKELPIRAKGKNGSFFETPNGIYAVRLKESNHFSSIGKVWMPWSMHFFGNYFIHGWPYYPGGTPVSDTFSGGCIRLSNEDARALYALSKNGTPVFVLSPAKQVETNSMYFKKVVNEKNHLGALANSILVADFDTGQILLEKDAETFQPIASITKLMTALVSVESINRFKYITVSKQALEEGGNSGNLSVGEEIKSEDLLYPLLLASSNAAAKAYEEQVWKFVNLMNQKAEAVGMLNTRFHDSSGISQENISTAKDLFRLLQFIAEHKTPIYGIIGTRSHTLKTNLGKHTWSNSSWVGEDPRFMGGKSGTLPDIGQNLVSVFQIKFSEFDNRRVAIIILGSKDHTGAVKDIISYLEKNFMYGSMIGKDKSPNVVRSGASVYRALGR